jgi:hypothetical protein
MEEDRKVSNAIVTEKVSRAGILRYMQNKCTTLYIYNGYSIQKILGQQCHVIM